MKKKENTPESAPWERVSQKMQMQDELVMSLRRRLIAPLPATVMFCSAHRFPDKELNRPSDDSCLVCPRRCLVSSRPISPPYVSLVMKKDGQMR